MSTPDLKKTSKFLSFVLRHKPEAIGLTLDAEGWADVDDLLARADPALALDRALLEEVVATSDKKRFALSEDGRRIRANQGHSVAVDLGLERREPPALLFHGTATRFLAAIEREGLKPGRRQHVHLSRDVETARTVGRRHGKPVILQVAAGTLHAAGQAFYLSDNGVWLTDHVAPAALTRLD